MRGNLSKLARMILGALIVIEVKLSGTITNMKVLLCQLSVVLRPLLVFLHHTLQAWYSFIMAEHFVAFFNTIVKFHVFKK